MIRVEAPARVHFGLLNLPAEGFDRWPGLGDAPGLPVRSFGSVGLMVDTPSVVVTARPAKEWRAEGTVAGRALAFAQAFADTLPAGERQPFHLLVERCPAEHTGLGAGTALGLSVARALADASGHRDWNVSELARRVGRGERSAVGVHGFAGGGLIVEAGKLPGEPLAPLIARYPFPPDWRVVLVTPADPAPWHGQRERQAFADLRNQSTTAAAATERLCRLVLLGLLPGLVQRDCAAFGEALYEFNARVGEAFASVQGGVYASPAVGELVAFLHGQGVHGVGQSSWGPTVFAVVEDLDRAIDLARRVPQRFRSHCLIAAGNRGGARSARVG